jgi:WD40 repeat protein
VARFHPDGRTVLAAGAASTAYLWNPFDAKVPERKWRLPGAGIDTASFSRDGRFVLASGLSNVIHVWDLRAPENPPTVLPVSSAAFHTQFCSDSLVVAAASFGGVQLWEAEGGRPIAGRLGPLARSLAFSPDGRKLAAVEQRLRIWNLAPDQHAADDLEKLIQLSAQREIDNRGNVQFLDAETIESLQRELSNRLPEDFRPVQSRVSKFGRHP